MMNGSQSNHNRTQGVRGTAPAKKNGYPPKEVLGVQIGHVGLVTFSDENGAAHQNMVFFIGGKAYMDLKGGERWLREQLGVCTGWLGEQLEAAYQRAQGFDGSPAAEEPTIPATTAVDVVAPAGDGKGTKERLTAALGEG